LVAVPIGRFVKIKRGRKRRGGNKIRHPLWANVDIFYYPFTLSLYQFIN
jgi:hypothetical protein